MLKKMLPIFALAPVFAVGAVEAWRVHLPWVTAMIAVGYAGFLLAYARAPRAR
ncbi:MAG TPA: hypothetical protein VHC73_00970 [Vitreimonas sp.]|jgi:hypothetical protein|nr:hypothetical protein [Vitreimonas sp.]